jgi:hypothetical protein
MAYIIESEQSVITKWPVLILVSSFVVLVLMLLFFPFVQTVRIRISITALPSADNIVGVRIDSINFSGGQIDSGQNAELCTDSHGCEKNGFVDCKLMTKLNSGPGKSAMAYLKVPSGVMTYKNGSSGYIILSVFRTGLFHKFLSQ